MMKYWYLIKFSRIQIRPPSRHEVSGKFVLGEFSDNFSLEKHKFSLTASKKHRRLHFDFLWFLREVFGSLLYLCRPKKKKGKCSREENNLLKITVKRHFEEILEKLRNISPCLWIRGLSVEVHSLHQLSCRLAWWIRSFSYSPNNIKFSHTSRSPCRLIHIQITTSEKLKYK